MNISNSDLVEARDTKQFDHVVQFYQTDRFLVNAVCAFLGVGIRTGSPALAVCTPSHWLDIERALARAGINISSLKAKGMLVWLDACAILRDLSHPSGVDWSAYEKDLRRTFGSLSKVSGGRPLQIYGEFADLLWSSGRRTEALHEEALCNELSGDYDFSLMCSYQVGSETPGQHLQDICNEHSHVLRTEKPLALHLLEDAIPDSVRVGERQMTQSLHLRDQRIMHGLREELAQTSFSLLLQAHGLLSRIPADSVDQWGGFIKALDRSLHQSLLLAEEIAPLNWQVSSLVSGLTARATLLGQRSGVMCEVEVDSSFLEPARAERTILFGILCEMLDRITSRLRAKRVTVCLTRLPTGGQLTLSHNGDNLLLLGHEDDRLRRLIYQAQMFAIEIDLRSKSSNSLQMSANWSAT